MIQGPNLPGMEFGDMGRMREMNPTMGQGELFSMFAGQVGRNFLPGMFAGTEASNLASGARSLLSGAAGAARAWQWERQVGGRDFAAAIMDPMSAVQQQQVDILDSSLEQQQVNLLGEIKDGIGTLVEIGRAGGGGGGVVPAIIQGLGFGG